MKKSLNYTKKTISLFLAVLMILSCWVWVAPEKAEAADYTNYQVKITYSVKDKTGENGSISCTYVMGDGTEKTETVVSSSNMNNGSDSFSVNGWPKKIAITFKCGSEGKLSNGWISKIDIAVKTITINGRTVLNGTWTAAWSQTFGTSGSMTREFAPTTDDGKSGYTHPSDGDREDYTNQYFDWPKPAPEIDGTANAGSDISFTLNKINEGNVDKTPGGQNAGIKDQYNVAWKYDTVNKEAFLATDEDATIKDALTTGDIYYDSATGKIIAKSDLQKNNLATAAKPYQEYYFIRSTNIKDSSGLITTEYRDTAKITVNYPTYDTLVDAHFDDAVIEMKGASGQKDTWSFSGIYGTEPKTYPTGNATKPGYTFKGFWTTKQPTEGNASIGSYEASFANPISKEQFDRYALNLNEENGDKINGNYITINDVTYYNAGTKWDPADEKFSLAAQDGTSYYGWWISAEIPVKFYDIDGKYLGEKTYKFDDVLESTTNTALAPLPYYNVGAYTFNEFSGTWMDITGIKLTEGTYKFGTHDLESFSLTPVYKEKTYKSSYTVTFVDPVKGENSSVYNYRDVLQGNNIPTGNIPSEISDAIDYSYAFAGWTTDKPENGRYQIIDEANTTFKDNEDWTVRDDVTYYPVYRSTVKKYVVQYTYTDTTGTEVSKTEEVPYGSIIATPAEVNRTYAKGGFGYNLLGWEYNAEKDVKATLLVDGTILLMDKIEIEDEEKANLYITSDNLADGENEEPIVFDAVYDDGTAMPYNVTFKYKDADGNDTQVTAEVYHGSYISQDIVNSVLVPEKYTTEEAQYTFANKWIVTEGTADKNEYTKDEFTSFSPTSHVTFEAAYGEGVPFYTVTYTDGTSTYSEKILKGSNVPAWTVPSGELDENGKEKYEEYIPAEKETSTGIIKFIGWYDAKQTDESYKETNGKKYTTADTVNDNLTLYAQYKFEAFKYTITFLDYKGEQLESREYEAGQSFADAFYRANKAAQYRDPDETYEYEFIGWDQPYDEEYLVCEGKDVTFTAQYKPKYVYYVASWYKNDTEMANGADPVATTKHTYESKVYNPTVELNVAAGKSFIGWYYVDAEGQEKAFVRGMIITGNMSFYAKYEDADIFYTVTTVVEGVKTKYSVAANKFANAVPRPADEYADADYHKNFIAWYSDAEFTNEFKIDTTAITSDITIYAKYEKQAHNKNQKELISVPTYYEKGSEYNWCACSREDTEITVEISMLTDKVAPTGTIYLGSASWSSTETDETKTGAGDTNAYYANKDTDVILTINDTGDINDAYNPSGKGKGIRMIRAFVSGTNFTQEQQGIASQLAITIYPVDGTPDTSETQNNTANYVFDVSDLVTADLDADGNVQYEDGYIKTKELEDGKDYIIYYYVIDKNGNVLNKNVRTAQFRYDTTAPVFTVEGLGNSNTAVTVPTYCSKATIKDIEDGATVTVNGKAVTLTDGVYEITDEGNYIIVVTDIAGNSSTKKITVVDGHTVVKSELKVTCEANGYYSESCAVCGQNLKFEIVESEGHKWVEKDPIAATCTENEKTVKICSVCGEEEITETEDSALGHEYNKDDDGNIVYTVITEATCKAEGKQIANCTRCGGATITEILEADANAHSWGGIKIQKPTCTEEGKYYKVCKYCYVVVDEGDPIPATGHESTYKVVTLKATCGTDGAETEYCKKCNEVIGEPTVIPATGKHIWEVLTDPDKTYDATAEEEGKITYKCKSCNQEYSETVAKILKHTVTLYAEDGETIIYEIPGVIDGTTLDEGYKWTVTTLEDEEEVTTEYTLTLPTKESDNKYKYTFDGWTDMKGKAVEFPLDVTKDIELKATFKATTIIYTHKFLVPTKWTTTLSDGEASNIEYAEIIGEYGDLNKRPAVLPEFSDADSDADATLKKTFKITFDYWATTNGVEVTDFTMEGDKTFIAVFKAEPLKYNVAFYQSKNDLTPWATQVGYGETVIYAGETPAYTSNDNYHYTFAGWMLGNTVATAELAGELGPITADTRFVATYEEVAHTYVVVEDATKTWDATCTMEGQTTEKCSVCGYEKVTKSDMLEHDYVDQTDGSKKCSNCGDIVEPDAKIVNITFQTEMNTVLKEVKLTQGKTYTYTAPETITTEQFVYTFTGWFDADDNEISKSPEIVVTAGDEDAVYTAFYSSTEREYKVTYFDWDHKVIKSYKYKYGATVSHNDPDALERDYDSNVYGKHYSFKEWKITKGAYENTKVVCDVEIYAVYNEETHFFVEDTLDATCQTAGGVRMVCNCGYSYPIGSEIPKVPHTVGRVIENVEPTIHDKGKYVYECGMCHEEITKFIPQLEKTQIAIQVYDAEGQPADYVTVEVFYTVIENGKNKEVQYAESYDYVTDGRGYILIDVPAKHSGWRAKIYYDKGSYNNTVETGGKLNIFGTKATSSNDTECTCTCHKGTRDGDGLFQKIWGFFYRTLQKFIDFLTCNSRCCADPEIYK